MNKKEQIIYKITLSDKQPNDIKPIFLSAVLMPNGEIVCSGKTVGYYDKLKEFVYLLID